jgi:hypothetical protein
MNACFKIVVDVLVALAGLSMGCCMSACGYVESAARPSAVAETIAQIGNEAILGDDESHWRYTHPSAGGARLCPSAGVALPHEDCLPVIMDYSQPRCTDWTGCAALITTIDGQGKAVASHRLREVLQRPCSALGLTSDPFWRRAQSQTLGCGVRSLEAGIDQAEASGGRLTLRFRPM